MHGCTCKHTLRPVTIGRFSEVGFSDFRLSSGTIATKSRKKPTFLKISSRICHFRLDEKKSEVGTYSAMYRSEKTKKPLYAVISGFSFQVPTRIVDPTSRINEFPIVPEKNFGCRKSEKNPTSRLSDFAIVTGLRRYFTYRAKIFVKSPFGGVREK